MAIRRGLCGAMAGRAKQRAQLQVPFRITTVVAMQLQCCVPLPVYSAERNGWRERGGLGTPAHTQPTPE